MSSNDPTDALNLLNAGYVADIYEQYQRDPSSIDAEWRRAFDSGTSGFEPVSGPAAQATNGNRTDGTAAPPGRLVRRSRSRFGSARTGRTGTRSAVGP